MKSLYGSILNIIYLMLDRTFVLVLLLTGVAIVTYVGFDIAYARNVAQLLVLFGIPLLSVWTASNAYNSKWHIFEKNWSTSPAMMIISRYMLFAIMNLIVSFLWYLSPLFDGSYTNLVHTVGTVYLVLAIYYPIMHLLKGERGDLDQFIFMFAIGGAIGGLGRFAVQFGSTATLFFVAGVYIVSLLLSITFYNFHKGREA